MNAVAHNLSEVEEKSVPAAELRVRSRWPVYEEDEIEAAAAVLRSGRVNALHHADQSRAFEKAFADFCDMPHAFSCSNGTIALELALRVLGIGSGDEVIVTARSFVASAGCVVAIGAVPVFADVDPVSQNITAHSIAQVITPKTRAIIAVHLGGFPCAMDEIMALAEASNLLVIEDCAQAHAATYRGRPIGSFGHASAFSFCTDKIMSLGGEGGMLLVRERSQWEHAWSLSNHGKDFANTHSPGNGTFRLLHDRFGSNYRMTEMQAAMGLRQLAKLPDWAAARRRNAETLLEELEGTPGLRLIHPNEDVGHAYYAFYAFVKEDALADGWSRDRIVQEMTAIGIPCQSGTCPEIYLEASFQQAGYTPPHRLPVSSLLGRTSLKLPVDHTLGPDDMRLIARSLRSILVAASA
jgi:dTDP-4-amino-4,6-dideoxygalactose transaminase